MSFTTDVVIGLEIHAELDTQTKLFCACSTKDAEPNTHTCPTCLGLPGSKPVTNEKAVEFALLLALGTDSEIAKSLIFSRKIYFYPDLVKNYQITQFEHPIGNKGAITLTDGTHIALKRVHLEEDPGALIYPTGSIAKSPYVLIDYNRSGHPLCEIVTEPVIESPKQARMFMHTLLSLLTYLKVFHPKSGVLKADANVSIKESGYVRVEVKNIGSFKDIERALEYEIARQREVVSEGGEIVQETRGFNSEDGITFSLRKKETEEDYGYITEPDLAPFSISPDLVKKLRATLPLRPFERCKKMVSEGVEKGDAEVISAEYELGLLYDELQPLIGAKKASHLVRRDIPKVFNYHKLEVSVADPNTIKEIVSLLQQKKITEHTCQKLLEEYSNQMAKVNSEDTKERVLFNPQEYVKTHSLEASSDNSEVETICKTIIEKNPQAVTDFKAGKQEALNFLFGQVMRETKGKHDPGAIRALLMKMLL